MRSSGQACREAEGLYPLADVSDFLSIIAGHQRVAAARITKAFSDRRDEVASLISEAFGDLRFYLDSDFAEGDAELDQVDAVRVEGEAVTFEMGDDQATVEVTSEVSFSAGVSYDDPGTGIWDSEDHVMLFVQKKRANVSRTVLTRAEFLVEFESIEGLAYPQKLQISIMDLSPDPVGVNFSSEDAWHARDDDIEEPSDT